MMEPLHPGGLSMTRRLLMLAGIAPPDPKSGTVIRPLRILDMGAGDGQSVRLLQKQGHQAEGIDLTENFNVRKGDFLHCPFPAESFDAVLSECAFYVSGDPDKAIREAARLLVRKTGLLLLSDVCFADLSAHKRQLESAGFLVRHAEDLTDLWKEYYIDCIWNGTAKTFCPRIPKQKCHYYLTVSERM